MTISYAGVPLVLPTPSACRLIERWLSQRGLYPISQRMVSVEKIVTSNNLHIRNLNVVIDRGSGFRSPIGMSFRVGNSTDVFTGLVPHIHEIYSLWYGRGWGEDGYGGWGSHFGDPVNQEFNASAWEADGFFDPPRPIRIGSLWWPSGASRWTVGHFLATTEQLKEIRRQVYTRTTVEGEKGKTVAARPFVLDAGEKVTADLYMLPARPLLGAPGGDNLHLLTLVDDRYWWRAKRYTSTPAAYVGGGGEDYYSYTLRRFAETVTGQTLFKDSQIPAEYLFAGDHDHFPSPWLIDWMAYNMGQRIVRGTDGRVQTFSYDRNNQIVHENLLVRGRSVKAGGTFLLDPARDGDAAAILPTTHHVDFHTFISNFDDTFSPVPLQRKTVKTADLPGFSKVNGNGLERRAIDLHHFLPAPGGAQHPAAQDLAERIALDWCLYQTSPLDVKLNGIVDWEMEGLSDAVEWTFRDGECSTRVMRPAFPDLGTAFYWHSDVLLDSGVPAGPPA